MSLDLVWSVVYTPPGIPAVTRSVTLASLPIIQGVSKDGPNAGYPKMLGKTNMTSNLSGTSVSYSTLGYISAEAAKQYDHPHVLFQTALSGYWPPVFDLVPDFPPEFSNFENQVSVACLNKISNKLNEFQGGLFIAELRETLSLIRRPAASMVKLSENLAKNQQKIVDRIAGLYSQYNSWQKRNRYTDPILLEKLAKVKRRGLEAEVSLLEKGFSSEYLKYVYGVAPLLSDMQSAVDRYNRIVANRKKSTVSGRLQENLEVNYPHKGSGAFGYTYMISANDSHRATGQYKAAITVLCGNGPLSLSDWGLTSAQVIPTVYEATTFSFLIDYFTNVNEILNAYCVEKGVITWAWCGVELVSTRTIFCIDPSYYLDGEARITTLTPWQTENRSVRRFRPTSEDSIFAYELEFPTFMQGLNIAALISANAGLLDSLKNLNQLRRSL